MPNTREKFIEQCERSLAYEGTGREMRFTGGDVPVLAHGVTVQECARPLEEWGEDYGDVLWWKFPIEEPPYVGSPLDEKWPAYHTHWTPIVLPQPPKGE